jgi:hypothetical protein
MVKRPRRGSTYWYDEGQTYTVQAVVFEGDSWYRSRNGHRLLLDLESVFATAAAAVAVCTRRCEEWIASVEKQLQDLRDKLAILEQREEVR